MFAPVIDTQPKPQLICSGCLIKCIRTGLIKDAYIKSSNFCNHCSSEHWLSSIYRSSMYAVTTINLLSNSVYYTQRMPHKGGTEPDLVMLIENMWWFIHRKLKVFAMMMMVENFIEIRLT